MLKNSTLSDLEPFPTHYLLSHTIFVIHCHD